VITPERRITAEQLEVELVGVRASALATITPDRRPLVSPVDGLVPGAGSGLPRPAIRSGPATSGSAQGSVLPTRGESLAVTVHGTAHQVQPDDGLRDLCTEVHGENWEEWPLEAAHTFIEPDKVCAVPFDT